jgi:hypothetical protein
MPSVVMRWPPATVVSLQHSLKELAELVDEVQRKGEGESDKEAGWLARLLVVRSCGYLEQVISEVGIGLVEARSGGEVQTFGLSWFPPTRNPSPDQIMQWVGRFHPEWESELKELLLDNDEELHRELSLLLDRRNRIAHGLNEGITVRKALDMKHVATTLADWFILRFNPTR